MSILRDSSELKAAATMAAQLLGTAVPARKAASPRSGEIPAGVTASLPSGNATAPAKSGTTDPTSLVYRGDRLDHVLIGLCQRSGFRGALVTDSQGLPLAVHNPPVSTEAIAAFTTVLGDALERAGSLIGQHGAEYLSMDINYEDKIVLRRFSVGPEHYLLLIIAGQQCDERSEVELSIEQIIAILA